MDIPGLVEAKKQNVERNKQELKAALSKGGEYKLVFVFSGPGGRIQSKMCLHTRSCAKVFVPFPDCVWMWCIGQ